MTAKATFPIQVASQYPQPETNPTNRPNPSSAYATIPRRSGRASDRRPNVVPSAMKPTPVRIQATIAAPGAAAAEMSVESAKTPDPMEDEITRAMRP